MIGLIYEEIVLYAPCRHCQQMQNQWAVRVEDQGDGVCLLSRTSLRSPFSKLPNVPTLTDSLAEKVAYALIWWMCLLVTASEGIDLPVLVSSPFTYCCLFFIDPIPYCLRRCVWSRMCIETDHMSLNVWGSALRLIVGINDLPCTVPVVQLHPCDMFVPLHVRNEKIPCSIWYEGPTHLVRTHVTLERMAFPCL